MQLGAYALATLEDVKQWLKIDSDDDDAHLIAWINTVSAECERFCNRNFISRNYTSYYKGDGSNILLLEQRPVTTITSIKLAEGADALDSDVYYCDMTAGIIHLDGYIFAETFFKIEIQYTAGYTNIAALPADLRQSIIEGVAFRYQKQDKKRIGVTSQTFGDQTTNYITNLYPEEVIRVWEAHKRSLFR